MSSNASPQEPTHYVMGAPGGGVTVLVELIKMATLEEITKQPILSLFSGGVIFDSGSGFLIGALEKMPAKDLLKTFIQKAPESMPTGRFFVEQTVRANLPKQTASHRFNPKGILEELHNTIGDMTLGEIPHGLSIGMMDINTPSERSATHVMKVPKLTTGHYTCSVPSETRLCEIIQAGSAIPTIYKFGTLNEDGQYVDPTIDQNPSFYFSELKDANPDAHFKFIRIGGFSPSQERLSESLREESTLSFINYLRATLRATYKKSEDLQLLEKLWGIKTQDLETQINLNQENAPRFNPIDASPKQLRRLCITAIKDIRGREEEYTNLAKDLLISHNLRHRKHQSENLDLADINQTLMKLQTIIDELLPEKAVKERKQSAKTAFSATASPLLMRDYLNGIVGAATQGLSKIFSQAATFIAHGKRVDDGVPVVIEEQRPLRIK